MKYDGKENKWADLKPLILTIGKKSTETEIEFKQSDNETKTLKLNKVIDIIRKDLINWFHH